LGSSYTTDKNRALWFATRLAMSNDKPHLVKVIIPSESIDAIWVDRKEDEIFMLPSLIKSKAISIVENSVENVDN
jgi:hypothetical protein